MASLPLAPDSPVGVLVVDDSIVARAVIARIVDSSDRFMVAGAVGTVARALEFLRRATVDVILLDINMPEVDGLTALPDLLVAGRGARIVVVSSAAGDGAAATVQALALGAADTLVKPSAAAMSTQFAAQLLDRLDRLTTRAVPPPPPPPVPVIQRPPAPVPSSGDAWDIVAIGASTGGIHALGHLLRQLPAAFRAPILVTQHLPGSFMPYFAAQLALLSGRPCEVAADRMRVRPGRIVVAPGDAHIRLVSIGEGEAAIRLSHDPAASGCLPSVDPMFASLAEVFGDRALAVVLSGMGRDGAEGAARVAAAGGTVIVQDQTSSVIWGMPGAVAAAGHADAVLPPDALGRLIASGRRP